MPRIDLEAVQQTNRTGYPSPFDRNVEGRWYRRLAPPSGLTDFGVSHVVLKPGAWSSQRHWHEAEDELIYLLEGELVLCEDDGETVLKPGDAAGWKANSGNGHCLINRTQRDAVFLEIGSRSQHERVVYPDIDMRVERDASGSRYLHKSGEPY